MERAMAKCDWCGTDPEEAAKRHEGPHATWCVHAKPRKSMGQVVRDYNALIDAKDRDVDVCLHCGGPKATRNPTGTCDHLYWPDNLSDEAKRANGLH